MNTKQIKTIAIIAFKHTRMQGARTVRQLVSTVRAAAFENFSMGIYNILITQNGKAYFY